MHHPLEMFAKNSSFILTKFKSNLPMDMREEKKSKIFKRKLKKGLVEKTFHSIFEFMGRKL